MSDSRRAVVDVAGGTYGGAAQWRREFDLARRTGPVETIGRGHRLTLPWMCRRERLAAGAHLVVASNNVSFGVAGRLRRVEARQALHWLAPDEEYLLDRMPRSWRLQVPIARAMMHRADEIVAPCSAMRDRILRHIPRLESRIVVRPHPVTPVLPRQTTGQPFILCPVVPDRYKNLFGQLRFLLSTLDLMRVDLRVYLTGSVDAVNPRQRVPDDIAAMPRVQLLDVIPPVRLADHWRAATAIFFPSEVESFGYPLAEARVNGIPVIALDTSQSREIAGPALRPYHPGDRASMEDAIKGIDLPLDPDPLPFDCDAYFADLFNPDHPVPSVAW